MILHAAIGLLLYFRLAFWWVIFGVIASRERAGIGIWRSGESGNPRRSARRTFFEAQRSPAAGPIASFAFQLKSGRTSEPRRKPGRQIAAQYRTAQMAIEWLQR
jgi:hypothetical protein